MKNNHPMGIKEMQLTGRSVSTQYIAGKYDQSRLTWDGSVLPLEIEPEHELLIINKNSTSVNRYVEARGFSPSNNPAATDGPFIIDPKTQFWYGPINQTTREFDQMERSLYTASGASQFNAGAMPYVRLDGTTPRREVMNGIDVGLPNRADGKIDGDFLYIYCEKDNPGQYFIGLPNLKGFMELRRENFPGVVPGANGLWN